MNLGNLLESEGRTAEAKTLLRRVIALNTEIMSKQVTIQVRLDLSKARTNLGESFRDHRHPERSIAAYEKSRSLASDLIKQFADSPHYRVELAGTLLNLALAYDSAGNVAASEVLVRKFSDNVQYMRTKPSGSRCNRKRHKNSSNDEVITFCSLR